MEKKKFPGKVTPYLFILPWIIGFIVFTAGPLILSLVMSFFDWPITSTPTFRGLGNYVEMFTSVDKGIHHKFHKNRTANLNKWPPNETTGGFLYGSRERRYTQPGPD